ncbi:MAG TPA: acyl-CoA dehydrogenase family protein [Alphaproteobacteria bacterium]|nr:acyl-CoA dehydrogenase family protein [Alphaproteobacteria bacterium]
MALDLTFDAESVAIADSVARFCAQQMGDGGFSRDLWKSLADLGVLALGAEPGSREFRHIAAACEALGRAGFPGPLAATFFAAGLLPPERAEAVIDGGALVSLGTPPLMPWGGLADLFIALDGEEARLVDVRAVEPVETLGGEHWARVEAAPAEALGQWRPALHRYELSLAAYQVGAAQSLLDRTAAHARDRRQFGQSIGEFQGVALPLGEIATRIAAARNLVLVAAQRLDAGDGNGPALAGAARCLAGQAARELGYLAHQTFGAFGVTRDGPVFGLSRRFQQWALQVPAETAPEACIPLASEGSLLMLIPALDDADRAFLNEVRMFLEPFRHIRNYRATRDHADSETFYRALAGKGWLGLSWPKEAGGLGRSAMQEFLLWNEIADAGIARPPQGVGVVAKTLIRYGTEAQKARWLEPIRRHEATFALAYSEPEAGSDLASVRCRAERQSDHYVINGNKCWNSKAHLVSHLWLLCRTGEQSAKRRALSLFIVPTDALGVRIRPIELMDGNEFTEIFLDDVRVPVDRRVGEENAAWKMMAGALADERHVHFGPGRVRGDFRIVTEFAARTGLDQRPELRRPLAELAVEVLEAEAQALRLLQVAVKGGDAAIEAAANKVTHTRVLQSIARTAIAIGGPEGLLADSGIELLWRQTMTESIGGGTTQIMQGIIARQELGLGAKS